MTFALHLLWTFLNENWKHTIFKKPLVFFTYFKTWQCSAPVAYATVVGALWISWWRWWCRLWCSTASDWYMYPQTYRVYIVAGASCTAGDLSMNSKCYRKFDRKLSWFSASNDCLSHGGSLALFTNTGSPSNNRQLIHWLNTTGIEKSYWIGFVRSWWNITNEGCL